MCFFQSCAPRYCARSFIARDVRLYVREIARWSDLALRTVQRELAILIKIGLVTSRTNGYRVFYRANRNHVLFAPLQQLVFKSERCALGKRKPGKRP